MNGTMRVGLKEWAVVCEALATGEQTILLRKGGIEESGFQAPDPRFWLLPTYVHQQEQGVASFAEPMLEQAKSSRPAEGTITLSYWAEVVETLSLSSVEAAYELGEKKLHVFSAETVRKRFDHRTPGLAVLLVRVFRSESTTIADTPKYAGCKSWVEFDEPVPNVHSTAVLGDEQINRQWDAVRAIVHR